MFPYAPFFREVFSPFSIPPLDKEHAFVIYYVWQKQTFSFVLVSPMGNTALLL